MNGSFTACLALAVLLAAPLCAQQIDPALRAQAESGDAAAQFALGDHFSALASAAADSGEKADLLAQSVVWLRKAADQSNLAAELRLADCYRDGRGLARDLAQAAAWYRRAAEQGDAGAQGKLAILYSVGQGVPQDSAEAYFWFDVAALVPGPDQQKYIANRQAVGTRITADELAEEQRRLKQWKSTHPPQPAPQP